MTKLVEVEHYFCKYCGVEMKNKKAKHEMYCHSRPDKEKLDMRKKSKTRSLEENKTMLTLTVTPELMKKIKNAVKIGSWKSRSDFIRTSIEEKLKKV